MKNYSIFLWSASNYHNNYFRLFRAEGKKYAQARSWRTTIVNTQWLHEIMLGQFRALHASTYAKYQQFNENPLGLDYSVVPHLMRKFSKFPERHVSKF